jgi:hypothetical protein
LVGWLVVAREGKKVKLDDETTGLRAHTVACLFKTYLRGTPPRRPFACSAHPVSPSRLLATLVLLSMLMSLHRCVHVR